MLHHTVDGNISTSQEYDDGYLAIFATLDTDCPDWAELQSDGIEFYAVCGSKLYKMGSLGQQHFQQKLMDLAAVCKPHYSKDITNVFTGTFDHSAFAKPDQMTIICRDVALVLTIICRDVALVLIEYATPLLKNYESQYPFVALFRRYLTLPLNGVQLLKLVHSTIMELTPDNVNALAVEMTTLLGDTIQQYKPEQEVIHLVNFVSLVIDQGKDLRASPSHQIDPHAIYVQLLAKLRKEFSYKLLQTNMSNSWRRSVTVILRALDHPDAYPDLLVECAKFTNLAQLLANLQKAAIAQEHSWVFAPMAPEHVCP